MSNSATRARVRTPAKLNLGLRVLGKRADGFHELETIFVAVSLYDILEIERRSSGGIQFRWEPGHDSFDPGDLSETSDNLVVRAATSFEHAIGRSVHVAIRLIKTIPVAAGLGGGSADAAATLLALWRLYPSEIDLHGVASSLGSDIPFFLGPPVAFGLGRGEVLRPTVLNLSWYAIVICPKIASPTREVYAALDLTSLPQMSHFPTRLDGDGFFAALALIHNDLQGVVERRVPEVLHWKNRLLTLGAEGAYVSGSGPSVFGVFRHKPDPSALEEIRAQGVNAFVVRPLDTVRTMVIGLS